MSWIYSFFLVLYRKQMLPVHYGKPNTDGTQMRTNRFQLLPPAGALIHHQLKEEELHEVFSGLFPFFLEVCRKHSPLFKAWWECTSAQDEIWIKIKDKWMLTVAACAWNQLQNESRGGGAVPCPMWTGWHVPPTPPPTPTPTTQTHISCCKQATY